MHLDGATFLLQWAAGGMFFAWITTRHREVGLGYGWLLRGTYLVIAIGAVGLEFVTDTVAVRALSSVAVVVVSGLGLRSSIVRRAAGVAGHDAEHDRRSARVAAMTGIERTVTDARPDHAVREFDPRWDLAAAIVAVPGLVAAGVAAGGNDVVAIVRVLAGALFVGAITDAMLLGHWYLVQPGLGRGRLIEMVRAVGYIWPIEVAAMLLPTGMLSAISGSVDDGWGGILVWTWVVCALTTIGLVIVTRIALKERYYSAVMAATGLLYLAILTAFGTDLVARAVLS